MSDPSLQPPSARPDADMSHIDSHGAVDLSTPAPPGEQSPGVEPSVRLDVPLIRTADESSFDDVMAASRTLPVVVALWSSRTLASKSSLEVLEALAREFAGRFQLVEIDVDSSPAIAQAFQVQSLPTVVALVAGRPVPLFQGSPARDQIAPVIEELLQVSAQMGVTGAVAVSEEDTIAPIPEEHRAALQAESDGDFARAVEAWEGVIDRNPRDEAAKSHLARVRMVARSLSEVGSQDAGARADAAFAAGDAEGAFAILLDDVASADSAEDRDAARVRLLDLFRVAGNTPEVREARKKLSTLLMV